MYKFLLKKYIGSQDLRNKKNRDKAIRLTGIVGLFINLLLFGIKIIVGLISGSISIISDSFNNLADSLNSIVIIIGAILSSVPADKEHPYGHGRTEYIVTMSVGMFIIVIGVQLFISSFKGIFSSETIAANSFTFIILAISIILKLYMYSYNMKMAKKLDSEINRGIAKDSLNDVISTVLVIISIAIFKFTSINIDAYIGIFISILIIMTGIEMFKSMSIILLGKKIDQSMLDEMEKIILSGEYIRGVHDIEIHEYGKGQYFGSCHIEAPANIDTFTMHNIVRNVEKEVMRKTNIRLSIHIDPIYLLDVDHFYRVKDDSELKDIDL